MGVGVGAAVTAIRARRINFLRPVHLRSLDQPGPSRRMFASRLSANGMFIRSPTPLPVGARVEIFLEARGQVLRFAEATVASVLNRDEAQSKGRLPGFGIRFTSLPPRSKALVEELIRRTTEAQARREQPVRAVPPAPRKKAPPARRTRSVAKAVAFLTGGAALMLGGWAHWAGWLPL